MTQFSGQLKFFFHSLSQLILHEIRRVMIFVERKGNASEIKRAKTGKWHIEADSLCAHTSYRVAFSVEN